MNKTKDENQHFAKAILNVRQDHKLTQVQFAEKIGVTRQAVSRWEMGVSIPNINTISTISKTFGISIDELLNDTETKESDIEKRESSIKEAKRYAFLLLFTGIVELIILPFWAEWKQIKSMETFKTAHAYSYEYILEYPLSIILFLALLSIGLGIFIMIKKGRKFNVQKKD